MPDQIDRTLASIELSRRRFLAGTAMAGFAAFLAACGTKGNAESSGPTAGPPSPGASVPAESVAPSVGVEATYSAELNWANWCCYLDVDPEDDTKWKTLEDFQAANGTVVNYQEVIDANESFVASISNQITAGQDPGWDIIVVTDWMASRLVRLGWLEQFSLNNMPNFVANVRDVYKDQDWDAAMDHHAPWQTGMTGIGYDPTKTGELTSLKSLL